MAGPPPPLPDEANWWLRDRFASYYRAHPPSLPERFGRREYAFVFFGGKGMLRHMGFGSKSEFETFHRLRGPAHSYYSTAYYRTPDAPTMQEKGWLGAELIFDLDADHVPGSQKLPYPEQLRRVKDHFIRLVDEFVLGDFGFAEKDILLTFSGGRGYHCHVLHPSALELSSGERREIVDYITGTGLDAKRFLHEDTKVRSRGGYEQVMRSIKVAPADAPGWGGRLNRALRDYIRRLQAMTPDARVEEFKAVKGIGAKKLERLDEFLARYDGRREEQLRQGYANLGDIMVELVPKVVENQLVPLAKGETDEPVTSDVKRVIRTPGTLHGKSGLKVVPLRRDELEGFDPLVDAVAFSDEPVPVTVTRGGTTGLKGHVFKLEPGPHRLPEYAAVFAVMRGWAVPGTRGDGG